MTQATRRFVDFAIQSRDGVFPARAREMAVDAITDCIGCMIAGAAEPVAVRLLDAVGAAPPDGNRPAGPLVGTGQRAAAHDSALYNGTLAHAIDYDDVTHPAYAHPGASLVPTILALAGHAGATGRDIVTAYILGIEVISKLGRALNTAHYKNGWHATATFGSLGAAATAASLLRLDGGPFAMALGMAASAAGGLRANFGTMTKPLHAGYAARNGVLAALMARAGITATADIFDHRYGFAGVFNHHENIAGAHFETWGAPLEILTEFGLGLKPYPACGAAHPPIEAAIGLREQIGGPDSIRSIRVGVTDMHFEPMVCDHATTGLEGKFCMGYCIAAALLDGAITLKTFTDDAVSRINASGIPEKVRMELDARVAGNTEFGAVVTIETTDGRTLEKLVPLAIGKPDRWFSKDRLAHKFHDCCRGAIETAAAEKIFSLSQSMEPAPSMEPLIAALDEAFAGRAGPA
jgi:2-methylcitrate dehydratase PrpD